MKHLNAPPLLALVIVAVAAGCSRPAPQQAAQNVQNGQAQAPAAQPQAAPGGAASAAAPAAGAPAAAPTSAASAAPAGAPAPAAGGAAASLASPGPATAAAPVTAAAPAATATPAAPAKPREVTLAAGTEIQVETMSALSTKTNKTGEQISATLLAPIVDGDWVIAAKGAPVAGVIAGADPGGRVKGVASMSIKLTRLTLADGRTVESDDVGARRQGEVRRQEGRREGRRRDGCGGADRRDRGRWKGRGHRGRRRRGRRNGRGARHARRPGRHSRSHRCEVQADGTDHCDAALARTGAVSAGYGPTFIVQIGRS